MSMHFQEYQRVRLTSNRFAGEGVQTGAVGYVIEIYPDGNAEIEFSDEDGITYAQVVATPKDVESAE